jgi:N-acetylmuramoyl-L-alanine amidase
MNIVISSGHGKYVRGASGYIDEVDEARKVVNQVADYLDQAAVNVKTFHDDTSHDQSTNLATIVNYHNAQTRDLDVSVHFNAYQQTSKPMGTEVLYVTQSKLAADTSLAIAQAGAFINRGGKKRTDLYFLNNTEMPAILIETCFVDSSTDTDLYRQHFEAICREIAEVIGNVQIDEAPIEPEEPAPIEPPTQENRVNITIEAHGNVVVTINGQDFQISESVAAPAIPANQRDIITTVFGGSDDPNDSAYPPYAFIDDKVLGVALPFKFAGERPQVRVINRANGKSVTCEIVDLGPWLTDDEDYVMGDARPLAETCYLEGTPLPRGPNKGKVPNGAGIDLTPGAAKALGIEGKAIVDWCFAD